MPAKKQPIRAVELRAEIKARGASLLCADGVLAGKHFLQHGDVSVYEHCFNVAFLSLYVARRFHLSVDRQALVRGALLHDYFLYDWHEDDPTHRLHGFHHARRALENACRDFSLGSIERDIIAKHMFPLNLHPPRYRESALVCAADKLCALLETVGAGRLRKATGVRPANRT